MSEIAIEVTSLWEEYHQRNGIAQLRAFKFPLMPYREAQRHLATLDECEKPSIGGATDRKHPNYLDDFLVLLWTVKISLERREDQLRQEEKVRTESLEKVEAEIRIVEKLQEAPNEGLYRNVIPRVVWREPTRTNRISNPEILRVYLDAYVDFIEEYKERDQKKGVVVVKLDIAASLLTRYEKMSSYDGAEASLVYLKGLTGAKDFLKQIQSVAKENRLSLPKNLLNC